MTADRRWILRGANDAAFKSKEPEVLLAGPAGTGKSYVLLLKLWSLAEQHPGARLLIVRKTRTAITETALVTWERDILGSSHPILTANPTVRRVRQSYRFSNGSEVIVAGMDKPEKVLSAEYDVVYCQEATELELTDWETLGSRLRAGRVPDQQMLADCNPTTPRHWLYQRWRSGLLKMYTSTHKDNPRFFDRLAKQWTSDGELYLQRLRRLTGVRRSRYLEGKWVAAEGVIFEDWNDEVHLAMPRLIPKDWPRYYSIDFGFTNPLVLQYWAEDPDGRLWLYREHYKTGVLVEDLARIVKRDIDSGQEPRPRAVVGDHDAEDRATFERHSGLTVLPADKKVADGIQDVAGRLRVQADGKPRLFICRDARFHPADPELKDSAKPTCTAEEPDGYCWDDEKVKEQPIKENDHGCDAMRYLVRHRDKGRTLDNWTW